MRRWSSLLLLVAVAAGCTAPGALAPNQPVGQNAADTGSGGYGSDRPLSPATPAPGGALAEAPTPGATPTALPSTPDTSAGGSRTVGSTTPVGEPLKAGDVDDNKDFDAYLQYLAEYKLGGIRTVDVSERIVIRITDSNQKGVPNATVTVQGIGDAMAAAQKPVLMTGKTASDGRLLFFPKRYADAAQETHYLVSVTKGALQASKTLPRANAMWDVNVDSAVDRSASQNLDLAFLLDATGSMGDEIARIQSTIDSVADRIKQLNGNQRVRYGLVAYRDAEDAYVTRQFDFTEDLATFKSRLNGVQASGGGDYAEDLETGLSETLSKLTWSDTDATRLVFLVADAPPHVDYQQTTPYTDSIVKAVRMGIKLFPLGASGLDQVGEYAFRQLAQQTLGRYLFLTYGGQTPAGGGVSYTGGPVQENNLDDLIVGIVKSELAPLNR